VPLLLRPHSYSSTEDILKAGIWTQCSDIFTHYLAEIVKLSPQEEARKAFQANVMSGYGKD